MQCIQICQLLVKIIAPVWELDANKASASRVVQLPNGSVWHLLIDGNLEQMHILCSTRLIGH